MARDNKRDRRTIRNSRQQPKLRQRERRWQHLERRFRERYGQRLTRRFLRLIEDQVRARRFIRDEFKTSVLTVIVEGRSYRVCWDYEWQRVSTFYPLEVADV